MKIINIGSIPKTQLRKPNLTDVLRFFAAVCVVWYHNPLYWQLGSYTHMIDQAKLALIAWSMPFFYAVSAKYSLSVSDFRKSIKRTINIVGLMIFYTLAYDFSNFGAQDSLYQSCRGFNLDACNSAFILEKFRTVAHTPGYYLSDLAIFSAISLLTFIGGNIIVLLGLLTLLYITSPLLLDGLFLNSLAVGALFWAGGYLLMERSFFVKREIGGKLALCLIATLLMLWGVFNVYFAQNDFYKTPIIFIATSLLVFFFLHSDKVHFPDSEILNKCSQLGQKYSFGIFIVHQFFYNISSPLLTRWVNFKSPLLAYLSLGVLVTILSILFVIYMRKLSPQLFKL